MPLFTRKKPKRTLRPPEPSPDQAAWACEVLNDLTQRFPLGYTPVVEWRRLRVTAGLAYYQEGRIALSVSLLNDPERLTRTLTHEYAHLLAYVRHGRRGTGHGPAWQKAMRDLGQEPEVRHRYEAPRNAPRQQVVYRCERCGTLIPRRRRLAQKRRYLHAACGGPIRLHAIEKITDAHENS